jgi:DnaJ-class molecular chaperone
MTGVTRIECEACQGSGIDTQNWTAIEFLFCQKCDGKGYTEPMTDAELATLIGGMRCDENQDDAIRRYVRETENRYGSKVSELAAADQELKRIRKLLRKALG